MFETSTTFQDSLFYDVSAWTFPLAFNVNHEFLKKELEVVKSFDEPKGKVTFFRLWILN